jgi:hypothetical protein
MTALKSALERAGINKHEMVFYSACVAVLRAVGYERALAVLNRANAQELSRKGHPKGADGLASVAHPRQPLEGETGQSPDVSDGRCAIARSPSPDRGREGHSGRAMAIASLPPVREPSAAQRKVGASVAKVLAVSVLDTFKVRDGRSIGDVRYGELDRLRSSNVHEAAVIKLIQKHAQADSNMRVRDVVKPDDLQRMIQKAAEVADATA